MLRALLSLALLASPAQRAAQLAAARDWEGLFSFPKEVPQASAADRAAIARALVQGCEVLVGQDAFMAYELAKKGEGYAATAEGALCRARAASSGELGQRTEAEEVLAAALAKFPRDAELALALGRLRIDEKDWAKAAAVLEKVPKRAKGYPEAQRLLTKARSEAAGDAASRQKAEALERAVASGRAPEADPPPAAGKPAPVPKALSGRSVAANESTLSYQSGVDEAGHRYRANAHFRFKYFNNREEDFGQRAEFQGRIAAALDEAYAFAHRTLGTASESQVDVVMYSKAEFATHFGAQTARAVAGFYQNGAIRMNDSAEITSRTQATLVHEYVHAVVDSLAGHGRKHAVPVWLNEGLAEYVEWLYQGSDGPPVGVGGRLKAGAKAGRLPPLQSMSQQALVGQDDPALRYAVSALAVRRLVKSGGMAAVVELIREVGQGASVASVLPQRFGIGLAKLDEEVRLDASD